MPMRAKRGLNFSDVETPQHIKLSNDNVHDQAANRENILYQSLLRNEVGNGNIERLPSTLTQETVLKSPPLMNFKRKHFNPEDLPNSYVLVFQIRTIQPFLDFHYLRSRQTQRNC